VDCARGCEGLCRWSDVDSVDKVMRVLKKNSNARINYNKSKLRWLLRTLLPLDYLHNLDQSLDYTKPECHDKAIWLVGLICWGSVVRQNAGDKLATTSPGELIAQIDVNGRDLLTAACGSPLN
jgi:hypothetical protein